MGAELTKFTLPHLWKEDEPDCDGGIKYDPNFGFSEERKKKGPNVSQLEMDSACLYFHGRDECALQKMRYEACHAYHRPFVWRCNGLVHEIEECYIYERIHDMKEFEREKRLNRRERLLREKEAKENS